MARQNRVTPEGRIIAHPARGLFMGNRGCLHDGSGAIRRDHAGQRWIICLTAFKGRRRPLMQHGRYTELFFLDEAVALAAGHRPCAECRRAAFTAYAGALGLTRATEIDAALAPARRPPPRTGALIDLPDGAMALWQGQPHLVLGASLLPWQPAGYGPPVPRPGARSPVLTPAPSLAALAGGYRPLLHPSARA